MSEPQEPGDDEPQAEPEREPESDGEAEPEADGAAEPEMEPGTDSGLEPAEEAEATGEPERPGRRITGVLGAVAMSAVAGVLLTAAVTPVVAVSGAAATTAINVFENLPDHLDPGTLAQPSTLYANNDGEREEIATFYAQDREPVEWEEIPQTVKDAAVAEEDPRFYSHNGIDVLAAGRAVVQNVAGQNLSGASTITMQYVRNVLVQEAESIADPDKREAVYEDAMRQDMDRKLQEMRYAVSIEKEYSKEDILLGYLNIALFGSQIYGIESAAQYYYGKSAQDLSIAESASLIAMVNNPSNLQIDIEENVEANQQRRDQILDSMLEQDRISQAEHDEAIATPVEPNISPRPSGCSAAEEKGMGHFCNYVQQYILNDPAFGDTPEERYFTFVRGGYEIETTIDPDMQRAAVDATRDAVPAEMDGIDIGSASSSVEVGTGKVRAMAQNRPFSEDDAFVEANPGYTSVNYNTDFEYGGSGGFQVGSTFKPVTLAEWLRTGHSVQETVDVNGRTVDEGSFPASCMPGGVYGSGTFDFTNDNEDVRGTQTVQTAIAQSLNGGLVSMQQQMDLCGTFDTAEKLGIHRASDQTNEDLPSFGTRELSRVPSNVYGGIDEIAPITMASAYGAFAGDGTVWTPVPIESITDPEGNDVAFSQGECSEGIEPEVAAGVAATLEYTVNQGLATHAQSATGVPHLAKTGTTDDQGDNWTVGASTQVSTATWVGNVSGNVSTQNFAGLQQADQSIWPAIMNVADEKYGGEPFPVVAPTP